MNVTLPPNTRRVVISLHPAFAMYGYPQIRGSILTAIARARDWARKDTGPSRDFTFRYAPSPDALVEALQGTSKFVVDVETPRDNDKKITICGVCTEEGVGYSFGWVDPYIEIMKEFLESPKHVKIGHNLSFDAKAFRQYGIKIEWPVVDTIQAAALLWPPQPKSKKETAKGKVGAKIKMLSLAACALRVLPDEFYWKEVERHPQVEAIYKVAWPNVPQVLYPFLYNARDCVVNFRLWTVLRELLAKQDLLGYYSKIEAPAGFALHGIEARGMLLDVETRDRLRNECVQAIEEATTLMHEKVKEIQDKREGRISEAIDKVTQECGEIVKSAVGCDTHPSYKGFTKRSKDPCCARLFGLRVELRSAWNDRKSRIRLGKGVLKRVSSQFAKLSDDYWRWLLFDKEGFGLRPISRTKIKKVPQVNDDVMEALLKKHPENEVLQYRVDRQRSKTRLSTRLSVEPELDGRVHFVIATHRTGTGRFSSGSDDIEADKMRKSPGNVQNQPDKDRRMYIASPGYKLVQADWSQVEARRVAWLANEPDMLAAFARGEDLHAINASAIYGCKLEDAKKLMVYFDGEMRSAREAGKRGTHGLNYYMQIYGLMFTFGLSRSEATRIYNNYHFRWKLLSKWQQGQIKLAETEGVISNSFGRKDWFYDFVWNTRARRWTLKDPGRAVATVPQGDVACMAKVIMNSLSTHGYNILTNTHDSFLLEVLDQDVQRVSKEVKAIMERDWPEFGPRVVLGKEQIFSCPTDIAVGHNWMKHHHHTTKCETPCQKEENRLGVKERSL